MKHGIQNLLCLIVLTVGVFWSTSSPVANAQDNFREFDRKMVATPAELFEALSSFQPPRQRKEIDAQRQKEIEAAGREFLSKLSPEQQEKAWEFAEKYLRKNGVDSSSSQKLMKDFGLPPEMQSELSKQFRKYSNRSSDSNTLPNGASDPDDAISQILRKARDKFDRNSQNQRKDSERADPVDRGRGQKDANADGDKSNAQKSKINPPRNSQTKDSGDRKSKEQSSDKSNQPGEDRDSNGDASMERPNAETEDDRIASPFELPKSRSTDPATKLDPNRPSNSSETETGSTQEKKDAKSDVDLDQLLKRLGGLKQGIESGSGGGGQNPFSADDLDWENVIKTLAEKESAKENFKPSPNGTSNVGSDDGKAGSSEPKRLDQSLVDRAKELISGTFDPERKANEGELKRTSPNDGTSGEKVGTRFDRLLVEAAQRSLESGDKEGVSKGVGSVLGSLIERIQNRASNNSDREGAKGQNPRGSEPGDNRKDLSSSEDDAVAGTDSSGASSSNDQWNRSSDSAGENPFSPPQSNSADGNLDPRKMLDSISNLSAIDATHVFTIFAIVGLVLFIGYLLAKSVVGDEVKLNRRKVIQQIRSSKIKTPKDLVETVDMFLLSKFGIKSSWWNARLAQRVLISGSPEFQTRVDDLIQDYVRARYMRDDIQIPPAEQQRYKKTLEELSALDIKPDSNLGLVPKSPVSALPATAEG
jgi:hypothetical protein